MLQAMEWGVYLHMPFCASRCRYCAFYSGEPLALLEPFVERLATEFMLRQRELQGPVGSVYLGGGTPSLLAPGHVYHIVSKLREFTQLDTAAEITLEVNPADPLPFPALRDAGITRLSVGVQSLDDAGLAALGRRHSAAQALATVAAAGRCGFSSLSADLLLGWPGTAPGQLAQWVQELVAEGVSHLSLYSLELHPGTELTAAHASGRFGLAGEAREEEQYCRVVEAAEGCGMHLYEVSNLALPGHSCVHNRKYWSGDAYLGFGPGAHSFLPEAGAWGTRRWNSPGLSAYLAALDAGRLPPGNGEVLTWEEALLERLFLQLRCAAPVAPAALAAAFGLEPEATTDAFHLLSEQGLFASLSNGLLCPTRSAMRRADGLAVVLHERLLHAARRLTRAGAVATVQGSALQG